MSEIKKVSNDFFSGLDDIKSEKATKAAGSSSEVMDVSASDSTTRETIITPDVAEYMLMYGVGTPEQQQEALAAYDEGLRRTGATEINSGLAFGSGISDFAVDAANGFEIMTANATALDLQSAGIWSIDEGSQYVDAAVGDTINRNTEHNDFWNDLYTNNEFVKRINDLSYIKKDDAIYDFVSGAAVMSGYVVMSFNPAGWMASSAAVVGDEFERTFENGGTLNDAYMNAAPMFMLDLGLNALGGGALGGLVTKGAKGLVTSGKTAIASCFSKISDLVGNLKITKPSLEALAHDTNAIFGRFNSLLADERGFLNLSSARAVEKENLISDIAQRFAGSFDNKVTKTPQLKQSLQSLLDFYYRREERTAAELRDALELQSKINNVLTDPSLPSEVRTYYSDYLNVANIRVGNLRSQLTENSKYIVDYNKLISDLDGKYYDGYDYFIKMLMSIDEQNGNGMVFVRKINELLEDNNDFAVLISRNNKVDDCYYSAHCNMVMINTAHAAWDDFGTLIHELGHMLHYQVLRGKIPSNFWEIISNARVSFTNNGGAKKLSDMSRKSISDSHMRAKTEMIREIEEELIKEGINPLMAKGLARLKTDSKVITAKSRKYSRNSDELSPALFDIVDALFGGDKKDLNSRNFELTFAHGSEYFDTIQAQFDEMIANFIQLKVTNNQQNLYLLKEICGNDFYNMLEATFNEIML